MIRSMVLFLLIPFLAAGLCGCVPVLLMAVGGAGVYAVSKDTIQGDTTVSYEALWDSAVKTARARGAVLKEDFNLGYIEVDANPNKIWIQLFRINNESTKMRVSARKYRLPNIDLAQDIFVKIIEGARDHEFAGDNGGS